ncbi:MAG: hypothetical protein ACRD3W_17005 [Terriglobales bacterium]
MPQGRWERIITLLDRHGWGHELQEAIMGGVKLIAPEQRQFEQIGGGAGDIRIGRDVASDIPALWQPFGPRLPEQRQGPAV